MGWGVLQGTRGPVKRGLEDKWDGHLLCLLNLNNEGGYGARPARPQVRVRSSFWVPLIPLCGLGTPFPSLVGAARVGSSALRCF